MYTFSKLILADIPKEEVQALIEEEKARYEKEGKRLGSVKIGVDEEGYLYVSSQPATNITRVRRITGYLSNENNFNAAKQAELSDRSSHANQKEDS